MLTTSGSIPSPSGYPNAERFNDFRQMFDKLGKQIDAVTVSTPDHTHAVATMMAIKLGKHVYTQKPMTHDVWEARQLRLAAREHKVATSLGNQGTASDRLREGVEVIRAGLIGTVKEVHVWTNRPIWPQSPIITARPPEMAPPAYLHWDNWLGTAPVRPYGEVTDPMIPRTENEFQAVPSAQLARLVGLRHRRVRRHGLPHRQPGVHGSQAWASMRRFMPSLKNSIPRRIPVGCESPVRIPRARGAAAGEIDLVRRAQGRELVLPPEDLTEKVLAE